MGALLSSFRPTPGGKLTGPGNARFAFQSSAMNQGTVWVELVGSIIIARIRGLPTESLVRDCHERVAALHAETECRAILFDALELDRPSIDTVLTQQGFSTALSASGARVAIVVPNTSIAYLARLAFGTVEHRVFYNDMAAAIVWLTSATGAPAPEGK